MESLPVKEETWLVLLSELPVFGPENTATFTLGATMFRCFRQTWSGKPRLPLLHLPRPDTEKASSFFLLRVHPLGS